MFAKYTDKVDSCNAVCPYCGDSWQVESEDYLMEDDERDVECDGCGKKFYLSQNYSIDHHSTPDCELNGMKHTWEPVKLNNGKVHDFCSVCDKCKPYNYKQ